MIIIILIILLILLLLYFNKFKNNKYKINFINLDSSLDRINSINNTINYNRFSAIDASSYKLSNYEISLFKKADFDIFHKKNVTCCALSHFYLWKKLINQHFNYFLICEDDIYLPNDISNELNQLIKYNYDILFLYNTNNPNSDKLIIDYNRIHWFGGGANCYLINKKALKYLINKVETDTFTNAVDFFIYKQYNNLKIGYLKTPIVKLLDLESTIKIH